MVENIVERNERLRKIALSLYEKLKSENISVRDYNDIIRHLTFDVENNAKI